MLRLRHLHELRYVVVLNRYHHSYVLLLHECLLLKKGEVLEKSFEIKFVLTGVDPKLPVDKLEKF